MHAGRNPLFIKEFFLTLSERIYTTEQLSERRNPLFIKEFFLTCTNWTPDEVQELCRNPLFIKEFFLTFKWRWKQLRKLSRNPLFIKEFFLTYKRMAIRDLTPAFVAILYSSRNSF